MLSMSHDSNIVQDGKLEGRSERRLRCVGVVGHGEQNPFDLDACVLRDFRVQLGGSLWEDNPHPLKEW